jgi:hypothetical protein
MLISDTKGAKKTKMEKERVKEKEKEIGIPARIYIHINNSYFKK